MALTEDAGMSAMVLLLEYERKQTEAHVIVAIDPKETLDVHCNRLFGCRTADAADPRVRSIACGSQARSKLGTSAFE